MKQADLLTLTQWLSPSYPVGAFSYSHGLETAISERLVRDGDTLFGWLKSILELGSGRMDALLLAQAYRATNPSELNNISELAQALSPSRERLAETMQQGAAFVRTTNAVWDMNLSRLPYQVAVGAAAKARDIDLETTTYMYLHGFAANLTSAAVRLVPLGQTDGQICLSRLSETCQTVAKEVISKTGSELGSCSFAADIASMKHETLNVRIFQS